MAERRMLSKGIIDSDNFVDMSKDARLLYYELNLHADDDGFVSSPKKIMRIVDCPADALEELIACQFIIPFDSGIVLIRDWKIHNYIRADRYTETRFQDEKQQVTTDDNNKFVVCHTNGIPEVDAGKDRLGQGRLGEKKDNALFPDAAENKCDTVSSGIGNDGNDEGIGGIKRVADNLLVNGSFVSFSENPIVTEAMKDYMTFYKKKTKKDHPTLKAENYQKVYCFLSEYVSANDLDYGQLTDMMVTYFNNKVLKTDWNINHFATEGILTNRFFEAGLC